MGGKRCAECGTELSPGARYCHRCGADVAARPTQSKSFDAALPWAIAAIALVALTALVAGQQFRGARPDIDPPQINVEPPPPDGVVRGPDISQLTPPQRAHALFDRMQRLSSAGQLDSVRFFAPMAIGAYQALEPLDHDQRFELGRIGVMTGLHDLARAQSDTLLTTNADHLLGLTLALQVAEAEANGVQVDALRKRLRDAARRELPRNAAEYANHMQEIEAAFGTFQPR